jgi:hypothetical protein
MFITSSVIRQSFVVAVLGALAGCAQSTASVVAPENVTAVYVNHKPYMGFSCMKLEENKSRIAGELEQQSSNPSEKSGPIIARLKGETEAVKTAMLAKKCPQKPEAPKNL